MNKVLGLCLSRFVPVGLIGLAAAVLLAPAPARATPTTPYVVTFVQSGNNVVATGSGEFNLNGLNFEGSSGVESEIWPAQAVVGTGETAVGVYYYDSTLSGPTKFGNGGESLPTSASGDAVEFLFLGGALALPATYTSGMLLSNTATWNNATFASLGMDSKGTFTWSWGDAADQTFTLVIKSAAVGVPEPAALGMFGFGALLIGAFVGLRRRAA